MFKCISTSILAEMVTVGKITYNREELLGSGSDGTRVYKLVLLLLLIVFVYISYLEFALIHFHSKWHETTLKYNSQDNRVVLLGMKVFQLPTTLMQFSNLQKCHSSLQKRYP